MPSCPSQIRTTAWSSTLALLSAYDGELTHGADYWYWDEAKPLSLGCALGGTITYTPTKTGSRLSLDRCSYVYAAYATGTGAIDDASGSIRLKLRFGGRANEPSGTVTYQRDARGQRTVHGNVTLHARRLSRLSIGHLSRRSRFPDAPSTGTIGHERCTRARSSPDRPTEATGWRALWTARVRGSG